MPCQCDSPLHPTTGQPPLFKFAVEQLNQHGCHGNHSQSSGYHPLGCFKYGQSDSFTNPKVFNFQVVFGVRFDIYIHYMKTLTPLAREASLGKWNIDRVYFFPRTSELRPLFSSVVNFNFPQEATSFRKTVMQWCIRIPLLGCCKPTIHKLGCTDTWIIDICLYDSFPTGPCLEYLPTFGIFPYF